MPEILMLPPVDQGTDYDHIVIGNSKFTDDMWDMSPFIPRKNLASTHKHIRFGYIENEEMKWVVKQFAYYRLSQIKPFSVHHEINGVLPAFIEYCKLNSIGSFREITKEIFLDYALWLKDARQYKQTVGFKRSRIVQQIIQIGQIKGWAVTQDNLFLQASASDLWGSRSTWGPKADKFKPIPEEIFNKILFYAVNRETDILTKAGIIIQSQTGLRINEVLSIRDGCVHVTDDGHSYMEVLLSKTERAEPVVHKVFINQLVQDVIQELSDYSEPLRQESGLHELFLTRSQPFHNKVVVYKTDLYGVMRLKPFIRRWDIRDNQGNLYPLTSHQFRATYVRELIKRKMPIAYIMKQFAHVSIEMTSHYLTLQEEEVKEIYSEVILSPKAKLAGLRAAEIRGKLDACFKGRTEQEIEDVVSQLSKSMSFNPLPNGVCLYDFRRGNCTDGDGCFFYNCPNYVTEASFYPVLRTELDLMEQEMTRFQALGRERDWQRQYVKYRYLKPLVESLEVQING
ncbi:hypothetical protein A7X67_17295 [Clostridium sp. W14A]|jgi:integrase|nr:hypothetical protein A7X67_17295 [Clostridium sp. W14A]